MPHSQGLSNSEALYDVSEQLYFHRVRLLVSRQTPKLEDLSWSAVHDIRYSPLTSMSGGVFPYPQPEDGHELYTHGQEQGIETRGLANTQADCLQICL